MLQRTCRRQTGSVRGGLAGSSRSLSRKRRKYSRRGLRGRHRVSTAQVLFAGRDRYLSLCPGIVAGACRPERVGAGGGFLARGRNVDCYYDLGSSGGTSRTRRRRTPRQGERHHGPACGCTSRSFGRAQRCGGVVGSLHERAVCRCLSPAAAGRRSGEVFARYSRGGQRPAIRSFRPSLSPRP